ncbi:MAG: glycosyltransferase family 2 protein [Terriglobales bacterium]|jgi:glycosyltransferase involved in cell wall biosynthesis
MPSKARPALGGQLQESGVILSVVIITHNEESNLGRTLASVQSLVADGRGELIVVDCGSTDRTSEIAKSFGAKVFVEDWKGYAAQKNSAIDKAEGDWILSLDADEEVSADLAAHLQCAATEVDLRPFAWALTSGSATGFENLRCDVDSLPVAFWITRKNYFLGRFIRHGGFYPDRKLRLFARDGARFDETRVVHEDAHTDRSTAIVKVGALLHHSYPTLADYIDHMNRYSSLGAEMAIAKGHRSFSLFNIVLRPIATFLHTYIFRLGFLDGREGLLLHLYHAVYVSWKYAKAWELTRKKESA